MQFRKTVSRLDSKPTSMLVASLLCVGFAGTCTFAQCEPQWMEGDGVRGIYTPNYGAAVSQLYPWDPDGAGPKPEVLILGHWFDTVGKVACRNIAQYDGSTVTPLGSGVNAPVMAVGSYQGDLIVGGTFSEAGGIEASAIARWDGTAWSALGTGLKSTIPGNPSTGQVYDVTTWNDRLVVAGNFEQAGDVPASNLAAWDGQGWSEIGGGIETWGFPLTVMSYHEDLYVAGVVASAGGTPMKGVARWNGTSWDNAGWPGKSLAMDYVYDLAVHDGLLYTVGLGKGLAYTFDGSTWKMLSDGAGRAIAFPGGVPTLPGVAQWNGQQWKLLSKNTLGYSVAEFQGDLYVGGMLYSNVGSVGVSRWDGSTWQPIVATGFDNTVTAAVGLESGLYVAGAFTNIGAEPIKSLARWNGEQWSAVGDNTTMSVDCLGSYQGELHAVSPKFPGRIARWDGAAWQPLGLGVGSGPATIYALHEQGESLYAGGNFLAAGGAWAKNIARWDGSQWHTLGEAFDDGVIGTVYAIETFAGKLMVGGKLVYAGAGISTPGVAAWDGVSWTSLGAGLPGTVSALEIYKSELYAGFNDPTGKPKQSGVARWNGTAWQNLVSSEALTIHALQTHQGTLRVGGLFDSIGGVPVNNLAQWNGSQWSAVAGGANGRVRGLTTWDSELVALGDFSRAGDAISPLLARLTCACPADCDQSGSLNIDDFVCFQTLYAIGDPGADCDGSGELDINDFVCFQTIYAVGC